MGILRMLKFGALLVALVAAEREPPLDTGTAAVVPVVAATAMPTILLTATLTPSSEPQLATSTVLSSTVVPLSLRPSVAETGSHPAVESAGRCREPVTLMDTGVNRPPSSSREPTTAPHPTQCVLTGPITSISLLQASITP